jgi:hypothetical protein
MEPEHQDRLAEQMRALLPDDSAAVSADEAIAIASIRANSESLRVPKKRRQLSSGGLIRGRSRTPARAWLGVIAALAAVMVFGFKALPSSRPSLGSASKPTHPLTGASTTVAARGKSPNKSASSVWPIRTILSAGNGQDIAPTTYGVFWLTNDAARTSTPAPTAPFRYLPATGRVISGPSIIGTVGSPAITVTGGWVWMVVGVGEDVVVERFDTSTLALVSKISLPVKDNLAPPGVYPVLTATIDGPLWVAGGEDLWELDPITGAIERTLDTDTQIDSMSTDPTGNLLYTGGEGPVVTEYSAQSGREIKRSHPEGIVAASVAATDGGVWVTFRTGMAGEAIELSASRLSQIAPPAPRGGATFGTYHQMGGVGVAVSEDTLWVASSSSTDSVNLSCADPATGAVRASETSPLVDDEIASGTSLYAFEGKSLVTITPPAKCFG